MPSERRYHGIASDKRLIISRMPTRIDLKSTSNLAAIAARLGALSARFIRARDVVTGPWARVKCQYGCERYGSSLCCPPHAPDLASNRLVIDAYNYALLFTARELALINRIAVSLEKKAFLSGMYKALALGAGACHLCKICAFKKGCRHPNLARPSMEACGIDVFATARRNGFNKIAVCSNSAQKPHFFGLVLLD